MEKSLVLIESETLSQDQILGFGQEVTENISHFSVKILNQLSTNSNEDASKVLARLNDIMKSFDIKDFEEKDQNFLGKLFNNISKQIEKLMSKYNNFNDDIDAVFKEIKTYELDIKDSNQMLSEMFEENKTYHKDLEAYVADANALLLRLKTELEASDDPIKTVDLTDKIELLEQRIYDLELAKAVAVQTAPQIKLLQKTNNDLVRKINSSFVITLPIFRQGLIQAITIKRQAVQTKALQGLDQATNELLQKNAENIVQNTKAAAILNGQPVIQLETLRKSYSTIINGIHEVEALEQANQIARAEGLEALKSLKEHMVTGTPLEAEEI